MLPSSPLILAFGDSLVAGYDLPVTDGFAAQFERWLPIGARVINAGVAGDATGDALCRLPRVRSSLDGRPDLAFVQVGSNDVLRQAPPSMTRANLQGILLEFGRCGVPAPSTTVAPPPPLRAAPYQGIQEEVAYRTAR